MLLLVQFRDDISTAHEAACFLDKLGIPEDRLIIKNAINEDLNNTDDYMSTVDAVIFGGSGQYDLSLQPAPIMQAIKHTEKLFKYIFDKDLPTLGVCFGCQLICQKLGATVSPIAEYAETGSKEIILNDAGKKDALFRDISSVFFAQEGHKESITNLPNTISLLASSIKCPTQIIRYKQNVYGVQFHPELSPDAIAFRWGLYPEYLKGKDVDKMRSELKETQDAYLILDSFVKKYLNY